MIIKLTDYLQELKEVVSQYAKYQKVLLVYSGLASNDDIDAIYNEIKGLVIFNKVQIDLFNEDLAGDGYRMIIFLTTGDDMLKVKYNSIDYINVYIPINNEILPFYHLINNNEGYILFKNNDIDVSVYCFLAFHKAINEIFSLKDAKLICWTGDEVSFSLQDSIELLNANVDKIQDFDIEILIKSGLDYSKLCIVELIILNSYKKLVFDIQNNKLSMVDVYKFHKDDVEIVDRLYKTFSNENFLKLIKLNAGKLLKNIEMAKDKILFLINAETFEDDLRVDDLVEKIKIFCVANDDINELYLYNAFN